MSLRDKLERVAELAGSSDVLERDIALEMLRGIYAEIKFGERAATGNSSKAKEQDQKPEPEQKPEQEPASEEPAWEPEPEPEPEPTIAPRRVTSDIIRSLYGTDEEQNEDPAAGVNSVPDEAPMPQPQPQPQPQPASTLGDVVGAGHKTLGETLRNGQRNMASHIAAKAATGEAAERPGLRRSIGLNDRFLMIRDIFGGDAVAFDRTIARLDDFTDLDEAVIWIRDNFDWSAESHAASLLVALLERKLGR